MIPILVEAGLRALVVAATVWAGLRLFRVSNVPAQKVAWGLVLVSAVAMPLVMHQQILPAWLAVKVPAPAWRSALDGLPIRDALLIASHAEQIADAPQARLVAAAEPVASGEFSEDNAEVSRDASPEARPRTRKAAAPSWRHKVDLPMKTEAAPAVAMQVGGDAVLSTQIGALEDDGSIFARTAGWVKGLELPRATTLAWVVYLSVFGVFLVRMAYGLDRALKLWFAAEEFVPYPEDDPGFGLPMRFTRAVASPVTIGSGVLLPYECLEWDRDKLRVVLAHERAHIRQGDFYLQILAGLYAAAFWFSPLGWWLKDKLSDLSEAISDHAGLEEAASGTSYAQLLLEFAALPRPTFTGVAMARSRNLSDRIECLLNETRFRQAFAGGRRRVFVAVLLVPAAMFAGTALIRVDAASAQEAQQAPAAAPAPASNPDAAPAQAAAPASPAAPSGDQAPAAPEWPAPAPMPEPAPSADVIVVPPVAPGTVLVAPIAPMPPVPPVSVQVHVSADELAKIIQKAQANVDSQVNVEELAKIIRNAQVDVNTRVNAEQLARMIKKAQVNANTQINQINAEELARIIRKAQANVDMQVNADALAQISKTIHSDVNVKTNIMMAQVMAAKADSMSSGHGYSYSYHSDGESWALITDGSGKVRFSGDWNDGTRATIDKVRKLTNGKFLWFTRDGKSYFIDDEGTVARVEALQKPIEELGREQEKLGKEQEELGRQQEELGRKQEEAGIPAPDISKEMAELNEAVAKLKAKSGGTVSEEQLSELEDKIGELQNKLGEMQGKIGEKQGELGEQQGKLGEMEGKLGEQQGKLGEQQGRLSGEADRKVKSMIDESLKNGKAKPVE
jgi:hypothetical protein